MVGFVMLHREILNWEWYESPETSRLFIHLILKVNYTDKKWQGFEVKRGQLITSANHLASELKLSVQQIRTALKKLESSDYITRKTTNRFTLITIVNYNNRQLPSTLINNQKHTQKTNDQQSSNNQVTTTKESNNENKFNKEKIELRKENFKKQVFEHSQYSKKILKDFFSYWAEIDLKTNKLKFEKQSAFEVSIRLKSWFNKEKNWDANPKNKTNSISTNR